MPTTNSTKLHTRWLAASKSYLESQFASSKQWLLIILLAIVGAWFAYALIVTILGQVSFPAISIPRLTSLSQTTLSQQHTTLLLPGMTGLGLIQTTPSRSALQPWWPQDVGSVVTNPTVDWFKQAQQLASEQQYQPAWQLLAKIPTSNPLANQAQQLRVSIEQQLTDTDPAVLATQLDVPILMYHYISTPPDPTDATRIDLSVTPTTFASQLDFLASHHYHTVTMEQLRLALLGEKTLPDKPIVLSFDDGYRDFYQNAYPLLVQHSFSGTLFVISGFVGRPEYVTWPMLQTMVASGWVEVGSHTIDHPDLPYDSADQITAELIQSKQTLEQKLNQPITAFCYPYGGFNDQVVAAVQSAGYLIATTTMAGQIHDGNNLLLLTRVRIKNHPMEDYLGE